MLGKLKIKTRLNILIAVMSLLLIGVGMTGLSGINASNAALSAVYNDHLLAIDQLNDIRNQQMQIRIALLAARQESDAFEIMAHLDQVRSHIFRIETALKAYTSRQLAPEEKRLADAFVQARQAFGATGVMPMMDLLQGERFQEADALRKGVMDPAYTRASEAIDALLKYQVESAKQAYERSAAYAHKIRISSIASIAVGVTLAILIGLLITGAITRGVSQLEQAVSRLADGDLTARVAIDGEDELGQVARAFNQMALEFSTLIEQVRQAADQVTAAAEGLSATAERVAEGSNSQTEQAAVAAASVEDLNLAVKAVAENAQSVAAAADTTSTMAVQGEDVVTDAAHGIRQAAQTFAESAHLIAALGQRSSQVGQIVDVIREIADQTNLLALNAAIEAARAGEQGRGFAVVADEVRKLAERTAAATAEISAMITAIQAETASAVQTMEKGGAQVTTGVELATQAGHALQQINQSVQNVVAMIQQIATATRGQSETSGEITARVEHIAQMATDNSHTVEETTHAAHDLLRMSAHLQSAVSRFRS